MKGSARWLVYCANAVVASSVVVMLANCGGGERPRASEELPIDASAAAPEKGGVVMLGFDPAKGLVFGDDGLVDCGGQAADKVITLRSTSDDIIKFTAKLTSGAERYKVNPAEGGIPSKGQATLQIIPNPIPQESDVTPDLYAGTLEVQFSTGEPPTVIRLHQTARGAIITSTLSGGGDTFDFGDVRVATTGSHQFSMTNAGNVAATASFVLGGQSFKIDAAQTATVPLAPGQTAAKTLTVDPTDTVSYADTLALSFNTSAVHCKTPPKSTNLKGKGTTSVAVSPGTLNFGQIDCGKAAAYQIVTISSTAAMNFTPVLVKGETGTSPYTLANDADGAVVTAGVSVVAMAAASTYKLRIIPKQIPSSSSTTDNAFGDTLRIETTAAGDSPHLTSLNQTARGAVFTMTPPSLAIVDQSPAHLLSTQFQIGNAGNVSAPYLINVELDPGQPSVNQNTFALNLSSGTLLPVPAPNVIGLVDTIGPEEGVQVAGKITLSAGAGAVLCADLPPKMTVTVTNPL